MLRHLILHFVCLKVILLQSHLSYYSTPLSYQNFVSVNLGWFLKLIAAKTSSAMKGDLNVLAQIGNYTKREGGTANLPERERKQQRSQETCKPIPNLELPSSIIPDDEIKQEVHDEKLCQL